MKLGQRIRAEREKLGYSQEQLAQMMYVSRQAVSKWENGQSYPDIEKMMELAKLFAISLDELVNEDSGVKKQLIKDGTHKMNEFTILGIGLILIGLLVGAWGYSFNIHSIMDSGLMTFVCGGMFLIALGIYFLPGRPDWLLVAAIMACALTLMVYVFGLRMDGFLMAMVAVVVVGAAIWLTFLILKR